MNTTLTSQDRLARQAAEIVEIQRRLLHFLNWRQVDALVKMLEEAERAGGYYTVTVEFQKNHPRFIRVEQSWEVPRTGTDEG